MAIATLALISILYFNIPAEPHYDPADYPGETVTHAQH